MKKNEFNELYGRYLDTSAIERKLIDVVYGPMERNRLDIYYPDTKKDVYPVVIFFHGGAFFKGDKGRYQLKPALYGLERGFAVVSVNYSLAPENPLPQAFIDAARAVSYIRDHAKEYDLDEENIVLWGESAGASLALYTGLVKEVPFDSEKDFVKVKAIIDWYGPIDQLAMEKEIRKDPDSVFKNADGSSINEMLFDKKDEELLKALDEVNPLNYLKKENVPPVFIEHGDCDPLIPLKQSYDLRDALLQYLDESDVPITIVKGAVHGVESFENEENLAKVFAFIEKYTGSSEQKVQ